MAKTAYPSDLTDEQWNLIAPLIPRPRSGKAGGRPRTTDVRAVVSGILYLNRSGCSWRMLPHDFPPWPTVHDYCRNWRRDGTWEKLHDALRENVRVEAGRESSPSAAVLDSQSVKTAAPQKKGRTDSTRARKSRGESVIWW
jgi:putative transposase